MGIQKTSKVMVDDKGRVIHNTYNKLTKFPYVWNIQKINFKVRTK